MKKSVYNNDFAAESFTYAGDTADYTYDNDGLLTGAGDFSIARNAGNGLPESVSGGGLSLTRSFSPYGENDGETFKIGAQNFFSWHADERYADGAVRQKTEDSSVYVYAYDEMGRLLTVTKDSILSEQYGYDDFGRRDYEMNVPRGIAGRSLTYDSEDRVMTVGDVIYEYDADGFLERKTDGSDATEYVYSSRGELLRADLPDSTVIEYVHDPLGRRIAKRLTALSSRNICGRGLQGCWRCMTAQITCSCALNTPMPVYRSQ